MQARYETLLKKLAVFTASFATTSVVTLGLTALFGSAARAPWLRDTPEARAAVASCAAREDRAARQRCLREVVAAAQAREAGRTDLAQSAPPPR